MEKPGKILDLEHPTTSELMRCIILGHKLPDAQHHEAVLELMRISADLARLGNLLRMELSDESLKRSGDPDGVNLFNNIQAIQAIIKTKIGEL